MAVVLVEVEAPPCGSQPDSGIAAGESAELSGELPTFERLYAQFYRPVIRWMRAFGVSAAEAEDVAQEVFIVVRRKLGSFVGGSLPAWIYRIARLTASDYRRRAWFRRVVFLADGFSSELSQTERGPEEELQRREAAVELERLLDKLSRVRRRAFVLFEIEGYSCGEIAELEQIPLNTVYTRLHHARQDFLRYLSKDKGKSVELRP